MLKIVLMLVILLCTPSLYGAETIYWQTYHLPPILIKSGPDEGMGVIDKTLQLIVDQLTEYKHKMPLTSHARAVEDIKSGKPVCHPSLYKTKERLEFAYFSLPSIVSPNHRLITKHNKEIPKKNRDQKVDLSQLITSTNWLFGLTESRSYGYELDTKLSQLSEQQVMFVSATDADVNLKLVAMGRLDATIAYPYEITYFNRSTKRDIKLDANIIQDVPPYVVGFIACPKNQWGKQVITRINSILMTLRQQPEYLSAMDFWWPQERKKDGYQEMVKRVFLAKTSTE